MGLTQVLGEKIYTCRLTMRRISEDDLPLILKWSNSEEAFGPYLTPERYTPKRLNEQFAGGALWRNGDKTFFIEKRECATPIGTIHYWQRQTQPDTAMLAVKIAEPAQRDKGYGTEAQKFLIIHLFEQAGIKNVEMVTDINNAAQQRCLSKLGFTIIDSQTYDDHQVVRTGYLFQLGYQDYQQKAIYRFHYE
ncbi:GCN5-related N-acetyltransferase [Desulfosarcina variabilis str. Montpellier]|uniref:GNAT family N-acetyltransferase n=1 Tax=Desulfosarcina variabilis TaxID=2300 RepID=UPI003AFB6913